MKKWLALALVLLLALPALAGCAQDTPATSPDAQGETRNPTPRRMRPGMITRRRSFPSWP